MDIMKKYQERVITEKQELDKKISKLSAFLGEKLFGDMSDMDVDLLRMQVFHMGRYQSVLEARIKSFGYD